MNTTDPTLRSPADGTDQDASTRSSNVVDFERPPRADRTTVRVDDRADRITEMTDDERRRLLVRIICELVALEDPAPRLHARAS